MQWDSIGFKNNPFTTDPINENTLNLYVGRDEQISMCKEVLSSKNVNLVIEGERGVGTTSFANFLRFHAKQDGNYFTPAIEIRVEAGWSAETLLAVIVANVVREIEYSKLETIVKDKRFLSAKAISGTIAETYRNYGIDAFGFGASYGKNAGVVMQPMIVPSQVIAHHLEDLAKLLMEAGYKFGLIIQLNNLDIGTIHDEAHMQVLFNAIRDYVQTDGVSWIFVGDVGLRRFIAQKVDRLDDIISYEVRIEAISLKDYRRLITRRVEFFRRNDQVNLPIEQKVFDYLYKITKGRLRYIFGLIDRLTNKLRLGSLVDKITLEIAKPAISQLAQERLLAYDLTSVESDVLKLICSHYPIQASDVAKKLGKSTQFISRILKTLIESKLVVVVQQGRNRIYSPALEVRLVYLDGAGDE